MDQESISYETVNDVWNKLIQTPPEQAQEIVEEMEREQPEVMFFLLDLEDFPFNEHEAQIIFTSGLIVWQIMLHSIQPIGRVTDQMLDQAEDANYEFLEMLAGDTAADFDSASMAMVEHYSEPEVLRFVVESVMEDEAYDPSDPPIREEYRGLAFVHLKTELDAFIASRQGETWV